MNIDIKTLPKSEFLMTIELTLEEFSKYEEEAAKHVSEKTDIPGFRRGQAPKAFVIAQIGTDAFFQEVLNAALPSSYFEAVQQKNLQVISRPDVKVLSRAPFKYEARVAVFPEINLKDYEKIKISKKPVAVTEKEIDELVEEMRKYRASYRSLDREIRKGDRVEIDFQGYDEAGAALEKTKSTSHPLFVGQGTLVSGFEEQLISMKQGEKKKFPLKFPSDFHHEPLRAKKVYFEVEIKRAEEAILPEVDETFVGQVMGEKKSVVEFRQALRGDLERQKNVETKRDRENELLEELLKKAKFDVPPVLIEEEVDYMLGDLEADIKRRGLSFESYLEKLKKEKKDLAKEYAPEAEKRVRVRLILNYLFRTLNIVVADDEMKVIADKLIGSTEESKRQAVKESLDHKDALYLRLRHNLMLEKLFDRFLV